LILTRFYQPIPYAFRRETEGEEERGRKKERSLSRGGKEGGEGKEEKGGKGGGTALLHGRFTSELFRISSFDNRCEKKKRRKKKRKTRERRRREKKGGEKRGGMPHPPRLAAPSRIKFNLQDFMAIAARRVHGKKGREENKGKKEKKGSAKKKREERKKKGKEEKESERSLLATGTRGAPARLCGSASASVPRRSKFCQGTLLERGKERRGRGKKRLALAGKKGKGKEIPGPLSSPSIFNLSHRYTTVLFLMLSLAKAELPKGRGNRKREKKE